MRLLVPADGSVKAVYAEAIDLAALGPVGVTRASSVEPDRLGRWTADLGPVGGRPGPFDRRRPRARRRARLARDALARRRTAAGTGRP
ncbi:MAG: hypothetical protein WKF75_02240 [Singulisphaera sp.]